MSIEENPGFSEESLRRIAAQKVKYRILLRFHEITYFFVIIFLILLNLITSIRYWWFYFPLFGWLIGLSIHIVTYLCYSKGVYPMMKRIAYIHMTAYFTTMLLLFAIDLNLMLPLVGVDRSLTWVTYPAISWGIPMLLHVFATIIISSGKITEDGLIRTRREKAIEKEMQKMKKKFGEYTEKK